MGTYYSETGYKISVKKIREETVRRTTRKFAIQTPARIDHLFERDISSGPSFLSLLASPESCAFAGLRCGEIVRSGSLSEDIGV